MPLRRSALLLLALAPALVSAGELDAAMRCVHGTVTSSFVPATAGAEQLANVAVARCADEIELAAVSLAGTPLAPARIDASRIALRRELHDYALNLTAGPASVDVSDTATSRSVAW